MGTDELRRAVADLASEDTALRLEAQDALLAQAETVVARVCALLGDGSLVARREAAWFLAHALIDTPEVRAAIAAHGHDADPEIRAHLSEAKARLDDPGRAEADHRAWLHDHLPSEEGGDPESA